MQTRWTVVIAIADPDTGEVERATYEVTPTPVPGSEHDVLRQLVTGIHPDAVELSYEGGMATFLDDRVTITTSFEIDGVPAPAPPDPGQGSLFDI